MKRLVCVVEGEGEVAAIPNLCARVMAYLGVQGWVVDPEPIRRKRSALVDARHPRPRRPCREDEVVKAMVLAQRRPRPGNAVLLLCDEDEDCAAVWGPDATRVMRRLGAGVAVMAVHEYEMWLLLSRPDAELMAAGVAVPVSGRGAKGTMRKLVPDYSPTVHQLQETRRIDIGFLRERSASFDKLVRSIAELCGVPATPLA
ncbi:hypothetical protein JRI60_45445 [Archangium violaceum]|uniref:DUF4276 family protein n=1 Tax=Archangium violaceum TaxID=83451 RepID=UPI001950C357|nr:DUF4276 family protein [Archangium violaceum]QRN96193.1 hypothetical protein JRI60_45445 [Archangium violaceum]